MAWCERHALGALPDILPIHVAAWIKELKAQPRGDKPPLSVPTIKLRLAALRHLFDWLVTGHVLRSNPALSVRGPRHVVRCECAKANAGPRCRRSARPAR